MAGDWIKMRADLFTHPKVVRIASALKADTLRTVGGLMSVWCLFDVHSEDGVLEGYTAETLDGHLRWEGFAAAMVKVGWLEVGDDETLTLPRFESHNGQSAKRRAQDADRKRDDRKTSASDADKKRTREEKRREEEKIKNDAAASAAAQADPVKDLFDRGVALLGGAKSARGMVGKLRKQFGDVVVAQAIARGESVSPSDPVPWLLKACEELKGRTQAPSLNVSDFDPLATHGALQFGEAA